MPPEADTDWMFFVSLTDDHVLAGAAKHRLDVRLQRGAGDAESVSVVRGGSGRSMHDTLAARRPGDAMSLQRKSPMKRGKPLKAGKGLSRGSGFIKSTKRINPVRDAPRRTRAGEDSCSWDDGKAAVRARANGRCEVRVAIRCTGAHEHTHHRKARRAGDHRPVNLLAVCVPCHDWIHAHPTAARAEGWIVSYEEDPEVVVPSPPDGPVRYTRREGSP